MMKFSPFITFGVLIALVSAHLLDRTTGMDETENVGMYGNHFEGDMILSEEQENAVTSTHSTLNGMILIKYRWPNKILPYEFTETHTKQQQDYIESHLKKMESVTCVKFVRRTNEPDYVEIRGDHSGCYSYVGRQGGKQVLNLQSSDIGTGCINTVPVVHEFLHALGFMHMQSAYDRDDYVTILWDNISRGTESNFNKYSNTDVTHFNTTYDYYSVMHYYSTAFSKNGKPTILTKDESLMDVIGRGKGMSDVDILKLNRMYECSNEKSD